MIGRRIGGKAALAGAICGTLPDLDSFIPYADAVAAVTYHRSFSHSLLVLSLLSPVVALGLGRLMRIPAEHWRRWLMAVFLMLVTHPLLDGFTVYGTQLLWPLWLYPVSWSTVFIIDPAYTLPLGLGVLVAMFMSRRGRLRPWANRAGLVLSSTYLAWTVLAKAQVDSHVEEELSRQGITYDQFLSTPAPFNSILWRFVIMAEGGYYEAFLSVLDSSVPVEFSWYTDDKAEIHSLASEWAVQRLQWFTHGYYAVRVIDGELLVSDLRMGLEPNYAFTYSIAQRVGGAWVPHASRQVPGGWNVSQVAEILERGATP